MIVSRTFGLFALATAACGLTLLAGPAAAPAQTAPAPTAPVVPAAATAAPAPAPAPASAAPAATAKQEWLDVFFDEGSADIRPTDQLVLDRAARTYREGQPIVMILTGSTDTVGAPIANLALSQRRALAVLHALIARGIPAERFQLLAKGETEPSVADPPGTAQPGDRRVEIAWR